MTLGGILGVLSLMSVSDNSEGVGTHMVCIGDGHTTEETLFQMFLKNFAEFIAEHRYGKGDPSSYKVVAILQHVQRILDCMQNYRQTE